MMKKIKLIISLSLIITILLLVLPSTKSISASDSPYKTFTENRDRELIETQEAYTPKSSINVVYNNLSLSLRQKI